MDGDDDSDDWLTPIRTAETTKNDVGINGAELRELEEAESEEEDEDEKEDLRPLEEAEAKIRWLREELAWFRSTAVKEQSEKQSLQGQIQQLKLKMARLQQQLKQEQRQSSQLRQQLKQERQQAQTQSSENMTQMMETMRQEAKAQRAVERSRKEKDTAFSAMRKAQANSERLQAKPFLKIEYATDSGGWASYPADSIDKIWEELCAGKRELEFDRGDETYLISFQNLMQENTKTRKQRRIRISVDVPEYWSMSSGIEKQDFLRCLAIGSDEEIFNRVRVLVPESQRLEIDRVVKGSVFHHLDFQGSSACGLEAVSVKRVWRIEHPTLFRKYSLCRSALQEKSQGGVPGISPPIGEKLSLLAKRLLDPDVRASVNEVFLFHGTSTSNIHSIVAHGLDFRLANTGFYGQGTYFASQSCKSWQYCCRSCGDEARYMIIARVSLGKPHYTKEVERNRKLPPKGFDSVVANPGPMAGHHSAVQSHQEFVIFDRYQAFPEFLVEIHR
ncbi:Poly [ADP-ribose] polymerase 3 [Symbiodinium microadriaticum]|uniref:Poly [ADP-ribose] polymerase 3 n=1 Tax=Symbiodinium microadriaticum TaxID=2951 RepID=A0A1Q9DXP7_SYMMI|nr:Poly [ADP-ribose] polymerase 3 [Symbiodinium microadriaticum]CAE7898453.1 PARP3 [Symbiodinium microadriaticum]